MQWLRHLLPDRNLPGRAVTLSPIPRPLSCFTVVNGQKSLFLRFADPDLEASAVAACTVNRTGPTTPGPLDCRWTRLRLHRAMRKRFLMFPRARKGEAHAIKTWASFAATLAHLARGIGFTPFRENYTVISRTTSCDKTHRISCNAA